MTEAAKAQALHDAWTHGDDEAILMAENDICAWLDIPLDETEQGLSPVATARIEQFVVNHGPKPCVVRYGTMST